MKVRRIDFSPDEFIAGVRDLRSLELVGAYWLICALIYSKGGPVDDDPAFMTRFLNVHGHKWRAIRDALLSTGKLLVTTHNGRRALTNERAEHELNAARHRSHVAGENSRKRWGQVKVPNRNHRQTLGKTPTKESRNGSFQRVSAPIGNPNHQPSKNLLLSSTESVAARARERSRSLSRTRDGKGRKT